jgi:phospholipid/cholesterol/gamma-HCH transport system ATP-binding protein
MTMPNDDVAISIQDVHKSFGKNHVHRGLSLDIRRGEIITLAGRSGEGKSVLLKEIIALIRPDSGRILIDGQDVTRMRERTLAPLRRRIGMLFQGSALFDYMNVFDNVAYPLRQHSETTPEEVPRRVREALNRVDLPDAANLMPEELSGGMKKRVGLARAIVTEAKIVLYDEPTTGLDPNNAHNICELIKKLQRELDITSVMVTHDMQSVRAITDRMSLLSHGRVVATGAWQEMRESTDPDVQRFLREVPE